MTQPGSPYQRENQRSSQRSKGDMKELISRVARWSGKHLSLVGALVAGGLAIVLYARTINFGFFGDDPTGHFRWIENVPWTGWFTSSPGTFVRPLQFIIYKLLWLIQGGYGAPGYHLVLLILHVSNTLLVGVFAGTLSHRRSYGWLAAILFTTFPLSHEVVSEVDALCHPLLVLWALLALVLFEHGRRTGDRRYLWAVHPVLFLALLTHENGLMIPVLILSLELIYYRPRSARGILHSPVPQYFVLPALFLVWWAQIPKAATAAPHTLGTLSRNTLPFLQVMAYPLLPIARLDVTQWIWLLALVGVSLILTFVAARASGLVQTWLFATAWTAIAAVPAVLFLNWDYLFGGPRLYYLASVGAALLWALLPTAVMGLARGSAARRWAFWGAGALLALAITLPPIPFIRCQLDLFDQATRLVRLVSAQAGTAPAGKELIYVNLPAFFISDAQHPSGCPPNYPFVSTGVGVFPAYADLRDFIRVNGGPDLPARGVSIAEYDPNWPPRYGEALPVTSVRDTLKHNQVYVFEIGTWSLRELSAAWQPGAEPVQAPLATFGDALSLVDAAAQPRDASLVVTLQWQVQEPPSQPLTAFAHVYDREGKLLAQHDGPLGRNDAPADYAPFSLWRPDDKIQDVHTISLQSPLRSDDYTIAVGLYDPTTMKRLPALTPEGAQLLDNLYVMRP
jgi:hypothetical protein